MAAYGERWHRYRPNNGETWEEFASVEVGDVWELRAGNGWQFDVCVTRVELASRRVSFARIVGRVGSC